MDIEKYQHLSDVMNVDILPEIFDFCNVSKEDILRNVYIKRNVISGNYNVHIKSHEVILLVDNSFSFDLFGTGVRISLNPSSHSENVENTYSEIPIQFSIFIPIMGVLNNFSVNTCGSVQDYLQVIKSLLGLSDEDIVHQILLYKEVDATTFIGAVNRVYNFQSPIEIEETDDLYTNVELIADALDTQIDFSDSILMVCMQLYISTLSLSDLKSIFGTIFRIRYNTSPIDYINEIITPHIIAEIKDLNLALEFPRKWLIPIADDGTELDGNSQLRFMAGSLTFNSDSGIEFTNQSSFSFTRSKLGNTGFTLSFTNAKVIMKHKII